MNKLLTTLLTTASMFGVSKASDHTPYELDTFRNNANIQTIVSHTAFKQLPAYLKDITPISIIIPLGCKEQQDQYMMDFLVYYNYKLTRTLSDNYCSMYGQKNSQGFYFNHADKLMFLDKQITKMLKDFRRSHEFELIFESDYLPSKQLIIRPDGTFRFVFN